jgi:hypothetical protein
MCVIFSAYQCNLISWSLDLQVTDFSTSQSAAHAEEYADLLMHIHQRNGAKLTDQAFSVQRVAYLDQAKEAQQGCLFHFKQSARRLQQTSALVSVDKRREFEHFVDSVTSPMSLRAFDELISSFRLQFHSEKKVQDWLDWFLRKNISKMIFPACQTGDRSQIPKTTNAVEHSHSLLHHAVGKHHDLAPGIQQIYLHVSELARRHQAIVGITPSLYLFIRIPLTQSFILYRRTYKSASRSTKKVCAQEDSAEERWSSSGYSRSAD